MNQGALPECIHSQGQKLEICLRWQHSLWKMPLLVNAPRSPQIG
jgi:hypothetical protein